MYASLQDVLDRYGEDALTIASDFDGDHQIDSDKVDIALADASAEIDTWLAHCHTLPFESPSPYPSLIKICVDIALYNLSGTAQTMSDEKEKRYKEAFRKIGQMCPRAADVFKVHTNSDSYASGEVYMSGPKRLFSRKKMQGLI